jgi:hypothetical protein
VYEDPLEPVTVLDPVPVFLGKDKVWPNMVTVNVPPVVPEVME